MTHPTSAHAQHGCWQIASTRQTGLRHQALGQPCEDNLGHRHHPTGDITVTVADGVSGGACGSVASAAGVSHCLSTPSPEFCAQELDQAVYTAVSAQTEQKGATTLAAAWLQSNGQGQLLHVGDCRIYHWHQLHNQLQALTVDQTFTLLGELPPRHVPPDNPARMLGLGQMQSAQHRQCTHRQPIHLDHGDMLLLCSDGLHGYVPDHLLAHMCQCANLGHMPHTDSLMHLCTRLLATALDRSSDDDISLLLLRYLPVKEASDPKPL